MLAAGPHAERPRFDPKAAARKALEAAKAAQAKAQPRRSPRRSPAQGRARTGNGRRHGQAAEIAAGRPGPLGGRRPASGIPEDRVARNGRPARWDGRILDIIVDRVEALGGGGFAPTEWSQRGVVRITGADKTASVGFPFFHATTSGEWVVTLRFFVPRNTFKETRSDRCSPSSRSTKAPRRSLATPRA